MDPRTGEIIVKSQSQEVRSQLGSGLNKVAPGQPELYPYPGSYVHRTHVSSLEGLQNQNSFLKTYQIFPTPISGSSI